MIDIDSDNTTGNNKKTNSPLNIEEDDEWMSDDNLDIKMDILRKQLKQQ